MKTLASCTKTLLTAAFVLGLLAFNFQPIGGQSAVSLNTDYAEAGNCPVYKQVCIMYEYPDGKVYWEIGKIVVVTPDQK